ncbi:Mu transposase C-terminal domain-containing protein [Cereibacter sphaeroides]|jgi:transposase InsO family protein|uniref:Mu transposase C-terminal domain-containing protein n=1 Tax=Cereibacter sphaeroides TaxID=1063 RepID=UPI0000664FF1|nr:hypothetical protein Rsph17029_3214 [Cereibacter sphaeroides ATCC 17029]
MNACVQHFHFEPGTLIAYDGYQLVVTGSVKSGLAVRDRFLADGETVRHFVLDDGKVHELLQRHDIVIDPEFSSDRPDDLPDASKEPDFENRKPAERRTAYQKEAWCHAARVVLKGGPYYVSRITEHYADIKAIAHDRQKLIKRGVDDNGEFGARDWKPKSVSNFCMAYFAMRQPHARVLIDKTPKGNTRRNLTQEQCILLDRCCEFYLSTSEPKKSSIVALVERRFKKVREDKQARGDNSDFATPHRNTVYRRLGKFKLLQLVIGRKGFRAAQKEFSPTQHGVRALKPGELIELDFWKGDVFTFSQQSEFWGLLTPDLQAVLKDGEKKSSGKKKPRQRLWICVATDVATRMDLGMGIAEKPNERTVIEVLDMVMRDKSDISRAAGCTSVWSQHTGLGTVIFDTGNEFFNEAVQTAILNAGGSFIYGRAGVPMDKPFVERHFGGLRTLFADELPGKTGYSPQCLVAYDKEGMAAFNAEEFRLLLTRYIVDHHPQRPHMGLFGKRPIDAWKDAQKYGGVHPPTLRVRRNATGLKVKRMLTKEGVRVCGLPFGDPSLFPRYIENGEVSVEVRIDPNDLREVTILVDGQQIHLANQRPDLGRHSIRTLMAAIKAMTESKPEDREFYEYVLAKHADGLAKKIEGGIEKHGLPSTEITPEELDWFETSHCFRLNILKSPEEARSADMGDLLAGLPGTGIHTAEEIAAEKAAADREGRQPAQAIEGEDDVVTTTPAEAEPPNSKPPSAHGQKRPSKPIATADTPASKAQPPTGRLFTGPPKGKGKFT